MLDRFKFWKPKLYRESYSQSGEDLIVDFILEMIGAHKPTYLDIGAHDPTRYSNTYFLYKRGFRGVLVEPNPYKCNDLRNVRPNDVCIQAGVGKKNTQSMTLYVMSRDTLSTFDKKEALKMQDGGEAEIIKEVHVPILTVNDIVKGYLSGEAPDFLSVDTEGFDVQVLSGIEFEKVRPKIICVETLSYSVSGKARKNKKVMQLLKKAGYIVYADTYINTIFVDKDLI